MPTDFELPTRIVHPTIPRLRDLSLLQFFRRNDEMIADMEADAKADPEAAKYLDDYLFKGPGDWSYPAEALAGDISHEKCVAYREKVIERMETELWNAANGEKGIDSPFATMQEYMFKVHNGKTAHTIDEFTPELIFDVLYEVFSVNWIRSGVWDMECQALLKEGWQTAGWHSSTAKIEEIYIIIQEALDPGPPGSFNGRDLFREALIFGDVL